MGVYWFDCKWGYWWDEWVKGQVRRENKVQEPKNQKITKKINWSTSRVDSLWVWHNPHSKNAAKFDCELKSVEPSFCKFCWLQEFHILTKNDQKTGFFFTVSHPIKKSFPELAYCSPLDNLLFSQCSIHIDVIKFVDFVLVIFAVVVWIMLGRSNLGTTAVFALSARCSMVFTYFLSTAWFLRHCTIKTAPKTTLFPLLPFSWIPLFLIYSPISMSVSIAVSSVFQYYPNPSRYAVFTTKLCYLISIFIFSSLAGIHLHSALPSVPF